MILKNDTHLKIFNDMNWLSCILVDNYLSSWLFVGHLILLSLKLWKNNVGGLKDMWMQINLVSSKAQTKVIFVNNNNFHTKIFYGPIQDLNHFHGTNVIIT
jgi:hypothetical protein